MNLRAHGYRDRRALQTAKPVSGKPAISFFVFHCLLFVAASWALYAGALPKPRSGLRIHLASPDDHYFGVVVRFCEQVRQPPQFVNGEGVLYQRFELTPGAMTQRNDNIVPVNAVHQILLDQFRRNSKNTIWLDVCVHPETEYKTVVQFFEQMEILARETNLGTVTFDLQTNFFGCW